MLSNKELDSLSISEKKEYFESLKDECLLAKKNQFQFGQSIIKNISPLIRGFKFEFEGVENIPNDSNVIFVANHSNSHDAFSAYEIMSYLNRKGSMMTGSDCLNVFTNHLFNISNATLLDRRNKEESTNAVYELSGKVLSGLNGFVFAEGTWNLHPYYLMHNLKTGIIRIASITQRPIIPTIIEYIEKPEFFDSESKLYKKCLVRFGKPISIDYSKGIIEQTNELKKLLEEKRENIWKEYGIYRNKLTDVDQELYLNHTYLKKFKAIGFTYDSKKEQEFLFFSNSESKENEYHLDESGKFCPGITEKNDYVLKKVRK